MTTEKMNVHKALVELKVLDSRITKEIDNAVFCDTKKNVEKVVRGVPVDKFEESAKSEYAKITDLIKRREAIKKAVSNSNAVTRVTIGDKTYSVAEAIEMNKHGLSYKQLLLSELEEQYQGAANNAARYNVDLQDKTDKYVTDLYGSKENKNSAEAEKAANEYRQNYEMRIVDPIDIQNKISALRDEIDEFASGVDSALSVSNAITEIEITY
jgi:hypothetical protein